MTWLTLLQNRRKVIDRDGGSGTYRRQVWPKPYDNTKQDDDDIMLIMQMFVKVQDG